MTHLFVSAGEPSGDLHGSNLIRALRQAEPRLVCAGFGGERMEAAGATLVYPLCRHAIMGFSRVFAHLRSFYDILRQADEYFRDHRPDAVVLIDFPGFHWWLARRARAHGIPVFYFVPPQLWAWGGWRIRKMRRTVNHVLCSLPFEEAWYRERGVAAHYLGHPYFDELHDQQLNAAFVEKQEEQKGQIIGLLPGSRWQELEHNLETMFGAAERIHAAHPTTRFLVACLKEEHRAWIESHLPHRRLPLEVHAGRTTEIIHLSHACIAVSGSVGLELLARARPTVVVYRTSRANMLLVRLLKKCRYISLVNLLADRELFPELLSHRNEAETAAGHVNRWLTDSASYDQLCQSLRELRAQVGQPGACPRAAAFLLATVQGGKTSGPAALGSEPRDTSRVALTRT